MILYKKYPETIEEKEYEIWVLYDDRLVNVVAFLNHYPVNGFRYQVKIPDRINVREILESDVINEMVEMSKNDIIKQRWQRLLKIP